MMAKDVGILEIGSRFSAILAEVEHGQTFYINDGGRRIAELRPISSPPRPRQGGTLEGQIWMADDFDAPLDDFKEYSE